MRKFRVRRREQAQGPSRSCLEPFLELLLARSREDPERLSDSYFCPSAGISGRDVGRASSAGGLYQQAHGGICLGVECCVGAAASILGIASNTMSIDMQVATIDSAELGEDFIFHEKRDGRRWSEGTYY